MADHSVTVGWQDSTSTPSSQTPGGVVVSISGGAAGTTIQPVTVGPAELTAVIPAVPEEAPTDPPYVVSVQMMDNAVPPAPIGSAISSDPFQILAPPTVLTPAAPVSVVVS